MVSKLLCALFLVIWVCVHSVTLTTFKNGLYMISRCIKYIPKACDNLWLVPFSDMDIYMWGDRVQLARTDLEFVFVPGEP